MKRLLSAGLVLQLCVLPAFAQNTPARPSLSPPGETPNTAALPVPMSGGTTNSPPVKPGSMSMTTPGAAAPSDAIPGANSFTEGQARSRLKKNGFSQVSSLTKGDDGIWRGTAMKNGGSVRVTVDYKGNISMN